VCQVVFYHLESSASWGDRAQTGLRRDTIQPVTTARRTPRPLDVWTLLSQMNCKQCGEATCIAFAFALLTDQQTVNDCPALLADPVFADRRAQLMAMV
jgi:ArsR family metal-binding transcriptional regulator